MKVTNTISRSIPIWMNQRVSCRPNAASRAYFLEKFVDNLLSAAIMVGGVTLLFFLLTM